MKDRNGRELEHLALFVYGSLMQGLSNHRQLGEASKLTPIPGKVQGHVMVSLGAFPGLIPFENFEAFGELYPTEELTPEAFEKLIEDCDWLESEGSFYTRTIVEVTTPYGHTVRAYVYVLDATYLHRHPVVYDGCWQNRGDSIRREWMNTTVSSRGFTAEEEDVYDVADDGEDEDIDLIEELDADDYRLWN